MRGMTGWLCCVCALAAVGCAGGSNHSTDGTDKTSAPAAVATLPALSTVAVTLEEQPLITDPPNTEPPDTASPVTSLELGDAVRVAIVSCTSDLIDEADSFVLGLGFEKEGAAILDACDEAAELARAEGFTALASKVREPLTDASNMLVSAEWRESRGEEWTRGLAFWKRDVNRLLAES